MILDVYDPANDTHLGTLTDVHDRPFTDDIKAPGAAILAVDTFADDDIALLQPRRVVRWRTGASPGDGDVAAFIVQDLPGSTETEPADEGGLSLRRFLCPHYWSVLGFGQGGGVMEPYGGLDGMNPRMFGVLAFDFPDVTRPEPTTGGQLTRDGWPDQRAERFVFAERAIYRRLLTATPDRAGPARMWFTSASWTEATVYLDGDEIFRSPLGSRQVYQLDHAYDGEEHVIAIDAKGSPPSGAQNSLGWSWASVTEDEEGDERFQALFRTFNSSTFDGPVAPTEPYWQAWEDYTTYPGVTPGWIMNRLLDECQNREINGEPAPELEHIARDWTDEKDCNGVDWPVTLSRSFRVQKIGHLLEELRPFHCEPEMTPDGTLRLHATRGQDRTGSVNVDAPHDLSTSGRGIQATRLLYETEGGFGRGVNEPAEAEHDVVMVDVAQFGTDLSPDNLVQAVEDQLESDGKIEDEVDLDLPDDIVPYVDLFPGDTIGTPAGAARVTAISYDEDAAGAPLWSVSAVPA